MSLPQGESLVDGLAVFVEGVGEPVVLAHAGVIDSRVWDPVVPGLRVAGRQVVRYDARGFGRSARPTRPYSLVGDARRVLDAVGAPAVDWVGLSQGAATGVDLALAAPERIRSLALVAPGLSGHRGPPLPGRDARVRAYEAGDAHGLAVEVLRLWGPLSFDDRGRVRDEPASAGVLGLADWFLSDPGYEVEEPSAVARLADLSLPVLVVVGEQDTEQTRAIADLLARAVPGARLEVLPDADHLLPLRAPDALGALLVPHLAGAAPGPPAGA